MLLQEQINPSFFSLYTMKSLKYLLFITAIGLYIISVAHIFKKPSYTLEDTALPEKLSEYGFFEGNISAMKPAKDVMPYTLNTPLFSDYARKLRFIRLPEGKTVKYNALEVLDFPVGTAIVKTFYYPTDARDESKGRTLMETRVLLHQERGWIALPYIWNEAQTDAYLEVAGGEKEIAWKDEKGKKQKLNYVIPNMNECKGCHNFKEKLLPIGPSARQLNGDFAYEGNTENQLKYWTRKGLLTDLPQEDAHIPRFPRWEEENDGSITQRARAYLDINCGHCHRPEGPANTSGLYLYIHEKDPTALGIHKTPVAAGRGSGTLTYDIVPQKPNESILLYRMNSLDPGVMMPELSRKLLHEEGITTIKKWIEEMDKN